MESWQASHIQKNLNYLSKNTSCNSTFLAILQERGVLSDNDYSRLEACGKSEGRISQSKLLYDIMTTRTGAYQALMEALRETVQTGSLQVLKQNFDKGIEDCLAIQNIHIDSETTQICRRSAQESSTSTLFLEEVYYQFRLKYEKDQESIAKLRWIPSTAAPTRLSELIPAGREDLPSYVARAFHEGEWIPGKFIIGHDQVYRAYIPYYGKEYEYKDFQVLIAPPGATGWVETEPKHIPNLGVVGGFDPAIMEPTYICRVWYDGKLVVGKVLRHSENCFVPYHGKEIPLSTRFEVLVYNAHGIS